MAVCDGGKHMKGGAVFAKQMSAPVCVAQIVEWIY